MYQMYPMYPCVVELIESAIGRINREDSVGKREASVGDTCRDGEGREQRKFIDWKKTKLFRFRWNWDKEKNLRGIQLHISSPSPPPKESSPQPLPQFV